MINSILDFIQIFINKSTLKYTLSIILQLLDFTFINFNLIKL